MDRQAWIVTAVRIFGAVSFQTAGSLAGVTHPKKTHSQSTFYTANSPEWPSPCQMASFIILTLYELH